MKRSIRALPYAIPDADVDALMTGWLIDLAQQPKTENYSNRFVRNCSHDELCIIAIVHMLSIDWWTEPKKTETPYEL